MSREVNEKTIRLVSKEMELENIKKMRMENSKRQE